MEDIDKYLSPEEVDNFYKKVVFDQSKIDNPTPSSPYSPLTQAVAAQNYRAIESLLRHGANPNLEIAYQSALSLANDLDDPKIIKLFEAQRDLSNATASTSTFQMKVNILKIPIDERSANILAVYNLLNDPLMNNQDGLVPKIIEDIKKLVGEIDPESETSICKSICDIKENISATKSNGLNSHAQAVLEVFSKSSSTDFRSIRNSLSEDPARRAIMDVQPGSRLDT